jgi:glucosylglycerate synthase
VEVDSISQQAEETIEKIENADLVVGILADLDPKDIAMLCDELQTLAGSTRIVVLQNDKGSGPTSTPSEAAAKITFPFLVPWPLLRPDPAGAPVLSAFAAYQAVFAVSEKLGARACCIVASKLESATPRWICQLVQPMLQSTLDLVLPRYARRKLERLLTGSVISPITGCLYAKRIHNPMGPDLGVSQRLFRKILGAERNARANGMHPLASLTSAALCDNMQVCEVHVGARSYPPTDWRNISSLIAQLLGPIFLDMERNAICWQRTRGCVPVPVIGEPVSVSQDTANPDISRMVESFQLGNRDLQEIWSLVLPPAILFELRKLSHLPLEQFRMPDELWARIVYDFALAHRLRTINRDHLLKSMTPLYLAWVASYALELSAEGENASEQRLERLGIAYESNKSYLVSRWRWPDRFNP